MLLKRNLRFKLQHIKVIVSINLLNYWLLMLYTQNKDYF